MLKSLLSNSRRRQFLNLLVFFAVYVWFRAFSTSVLNPHFLQSGVGLEAMVLGSAISFTTAIIILMFFKSVNNLSWWRWAIIFAYLGILSIVKVNFIWQYFLFCLLIGSNTALYFVPYNIAHFQLTPKARTSFSAGVMFAVGPVISFVAPLASGWLAQVNYIYIWSLSFLFFIASLLLVKFQTPIQIKIDIKGGYKYLRPTRLIVFLEGIWEILVFSLIPIFTLYFITTPLVYGGYLSYLALVGILANLFLGKLSDHHQNRLVFLIPTTVILAVTTIFFPAGIKSLPLWLIITGIIQFFSPLFWNFSTAWFVDLQPDHERSMPIRELILNVGRALGLLLAWINFQFQSPPTLIFYFLGGVMLLYPLVLLYNTKHAARS